jgi:hypothetical protein
MLTVKVRLRKGPPTPYAWEIYRSNDPRWIKRSMHGYSTREEAAAAGERALLRILEQ